MGSQNTIMIVNKNMVRGEATGSGSITPGHLLYRTSADLVAVHAAASGRHQSMFAIEDELQGKDISDVYATATKVQYVVCNRGDQIHALIANGANIVKGDYLTSAGDGTLKEMKGDSTILEEFPVAVARETCDMTGSSAEDDPRCIVEIV